MPETTQPAKATATPTKAPVEPKPVPLDSPNVPVSLVPIPHVVGLTKREQFAMVFGAAIMTRQARTPRSLAREVVQFTDAFLEALEESR